MSQQSRKPPLSSIHEFALLESLPLSLVHASHSCIPAKGSANISVPRISSSSIDCFIYQKCQSSANLFLSRFRLLPSSMAKRFTHMCKISSIQLSLQWHGVLCRPSTSSLLEARSASSFCNFLGSKGPLSLMQPVDFRAW